MARKQEACCPPETDVTASKVASVLSIDERGQMVLPKDLRKRAGIGPGDKLAVVTHVQSVPASTVFASRRQGASPQSERPSTHPTSGETKVTDSGCIARGDNPLVGGGDGVALGVGDCDGTLIDAEGTSEVLAVGFGCGFPEAQPARTRIENAATAPSLCR